MNIHALLSPTESPAREESSSSSSTPPRARPAAGKSALSRELSHSPTSTASDPNASSRPSTANLSPTRTQQAFLVPAFQRGAVPNFRPLQPPPTSHPSSAPQDYGSNYPRPLADRRTSSTPHVDTLQDFARQPASYNRTYSTGDIRHHQPASSHRSGSLAYPPSSARPPIFHSGSSGRSVIDLTMSEAAAQTPPPRVVESKALSEAQSARVTGLLNYLAENSYAYDSHVELINLLHQGFIVHASPPADGSSQERRDPHDYALLAPLRQAREAMDTRFAVGEDIWDDWLSDEILLATTSEERMRVTELFQKAVVDEPASVKLWQMYAGWVWFNYVACNAPNSSSAAPGQNKWTDEDRALCKDLFTRNLVIDVLEQAIASTQWRVDESHVVWNRYAELVQEDFPPTPTSKEIERLRGMYVARLQFPHATWEETHQMFWSIVSKYESDKWETIMAEVQGLTGPAKSQMSQREPHESSLHRAIEVGDKEAIFNQFSQYLQWEKNRERKQKHRSALDKELRCALYERALLRFPTYVDWWLDYVDFVISSGPSTPVLPLIERATRHCPWSGDLWARRILQSDVEGKPHEEIEATKHRATNSGLLDVGGMEEMVKVLQQWCSFLRRHAFKPSSTEDDIDTAEVGITMALEDIQQAGKNIYGNDFQGDPLFRVEQIQIKFLSEARRFEDARKIYQGLVKAQKNSFDFWLKYYYWELWIWGYDRIKDLRRVETPENGPDKASAVLQEALMQRDLDEPDKILYMYNNHFQQNESGPRLRTALVDAREFSRQLAHRRAAAAAEAAQQDPAAQVSAQHQPPSRAEDIPLARGDSTGEKRKRSEETLPNGHSEKKAKTEIEGTDSVPDPQQRPSESSSATQIKRDREHNTITVHNLPGDVQEFDVKKFFREVGVPLSIHLLQDKDAETYTATVEFETHEDVLAAKTRNGKDFNGNEIRIQSGEGSTLYVTNYPPEFDEASIRGLFEDYGDIVNIRFPNLKYDGRRRFCYVQYLTMDMAKAAEATMDGKILDGAHRLIAKLSDPGARKQRAGAVAEGRELYIRNIDRYHSNEAELKTFFGQYGSVVNVNIVRLVNGRSTGAAFITFSTADEATAALAANNKPLHDRILHVERAHQKGRAPPSERAYKEDIIINQHASASPEPRTTNGRRGSDISMASNTQQQQLGDELYKTARERKIAIFNLPETVNDARVRTAMEEHGALVKIQMRRNLGGAIVEFVDIKVAFNVRQGVDCSSLGPDVKTGDVADFLPKKKFPTDQYQHQQQQSTTASGYGGGSESGSGLGDMRPPSLIARPMQRGGRRGGLGFKRGRGFGTGSRSATDTGGEGSSSLSGGKNNADFRNMFLKGKEGGGDSGASKAELDRESL